MARAALMALHANALTTHGEEVRCELLQLEDETEPPARCSHGAVWLEDLTAMVIFGGRNSDQTDLLDDVWLLEYSSLPNGVTTWRWREVDRGIGAVLPPESRCHPMPRSHFAHCGLSGRSFFVHGGFGGEAVGTLSDAWVCGIDDGIDDLLLSTVVSPQLSSLSRQESERLTHQVSDSYRRLAPQVSCSPSLSCSQAPEFALLASWRRVEADGRPPPKCCGHAAVRIHDRVVLHGGWGSPYSPCSLGPVHVLENLLSSEAIGARPARPFYTELGMVPSPSCRAFASLHAVGNRAVAMGGWGARENDTLDDVDRAWHGACALPVHESLGPLALIHGGRDCKGLTMDDILVLQWVP